MKKINDNMLVMLEFLDITGISVDDTEASFDEDNNILSFEKEEYNKEDNEWNKQRTTVKLFEDKNSIIIKNNIRHEYDFETIGDDPMTSYEIYQVISDQTVIKFKVIDEKLNIYHATISQSIKEDSVVGGDWTIIDFDSISDFLDKEKRDYLALGEEIIPIEKISYPVPTDYKITDGISRVEETSSIKSLIKSFNNI